MNVDVLGHLLNGIALAFAAIPYFTVPFGLWFGLDAAHLLDEFLFGNKFARVLIPFRIMLALSAFLQLCRLIPFLASMSLIAIRSILSVLDFLGRYHSLICRDRDQSNDLLKIYVTLQILLQSIYECCSNSFWGNGVLGLCGFYFFES